MGKVWPALGLALLTMLAGCAAAGEHAAAQRRWAAVSPQHYILRTAEQVGSLQCDQAVEVRDERLVQILHNSCPTSLWTVSWLFRKAAPAAPTEGLCIRSAPGLGCLCRQQVIRQVEYDPQQGYPVRMRIRTTSRGAWSDPGLWRFLAQRRAIPSCARSVASSSWTITVSELRPMP